ncbi:MAG: hypothetical protein COA79_13700 [Planctomycetota bacterium]|nr:MAG: hypothetical protein COA79_13700 [Planctomycetota bacterium]
MVYIIAGMMGVAVVLFLYAGFSLFSKGWKTYEDSYLEGTEKTLDATFLSMPAQNLFYLSILCFFVFGGFAFLITGMFYVGIPIGFIAFFFPKIALIMVKKRRDRKFMDQLPNAVTSVSNSLKSGFSLIQALDRITIEMTNPIAQEFRLMLYEIRLGLSVEDGFLNLLKRMPGQDLDIVINAVLISNEVGGNLAEVFDKIGETIRERNRIEGKIRSLTAQGKMQGVVISLMPFALIVGLYVFEKNIVTAFFQKPAGWVIFAVVCLMIGVGAVWIAKIVKIEV